MAYRLKGREVEIGIIRHSGDVVDSFIESAYYVDSGRDLTDEELDQLTDEHAAEIHDDWFEWQVSRADF